MESCLFVNFHSEVDNQNRDLSIVVALQPRLGLMRPPIAASSGVVMGQSTVEVANCDSLRHSDRIAARIGLCRRGE
jgi:hypothetical protein